MDPLELHFEFRQLSDEDKLQFLRLCNSLTSNLTGEEVVKLLSFSAYLIYHLKKKYPKMNNFEIMYKLFPGYKMQCQSIVLWTIPFLNIIDDEKQAFVTCGLNAKEMIKEIEPLLEKSIPF